MEKTRKLLFENISTRQMLIKNTFWLTSSTIVSRLIRGAMIIYAARVLGTEGYGVFSYALGLAAFFTVFSDIGLSGLLTRQAVKHPEQIREYLSTTFVIKIVILTLTIMTVIFIAPFFTKIKEALPLLPIVAVLLSFDSLRNYGFSVIRAQNRMELEGILSLATEVFISALGFAVLFIQPNSKLLAIGYTVGSGMGFIMIIIALRHQFRYAFSYFKKELVRPILTSAWPFALMGLLGGFMINIDTILIGWFRNAHELGLYAAAQRPVSLLYLLPGFLSTALFPLASRFFRDRQYERAKIMIEKSIAASLAMAIPLAVGGVIVGAPLTVLLFGLPYADAALTFQLLMTTMLLVFPGTVIGNIIFAAERQDIFIAASLAGAISNVVLDLALIPSYGIAGSAVATIAALLLTNGYNWYKTTKEIISFAVLPLIKKILLATTLMAAATAALQYAGVNVLANVALSAAIYFILLTILKDPLLKETKEIINSAA